MKTATFMTNTTSKSTNTLDRIALRKTQTPRYILTCTIPKWQRQNTEKVNILINLVTRFNS